MSTLPGNTLRLLELFVADRYLKGPTSAVRSRATQSDLRVLMERGLVTVAGDDLSRGDVTVTDAGRALVDETWA